MISVEDGVLAFMSISVKLRFILSFSFFFFFVNLGVSAKYESVLLKSCLNFRISVFLNRHSPENFFMYKFSDFIKLTGKFRFVFVRVSRFVYSFDTRIFKSWVRPNLLVKDGTPVKAKLKWKSEHEHRLWLWQKSIVEKLTIIKGNETVWAVVRSRSLPLVVQLCLYGLWPFPLRSAWER